MAVTVEQVRAAIRQRNVRWEAKETDISRRIAQAGHALFGLNLTEERRLSLFRSAQEMETRAFLSLPPPPPKVDWRDHRDCNWVTAVKHQGTCGSCVAFATCAVLEVRARLVRSDCRVPIDLSEADLFYCGCGSCCGTGWDFVAALERCKGSGVGRESDFPYTPGNQPCRRIPPVVQVDSYLAETLPDKRRSALAANGPVIAGMRVFEDFAYYRGGVYSHVTGDFLGFHAVAVVGYDDVDRYWIVKNSWGPGWGEGGFCRLAYNEVGLDTEFAFYDPTVQVLAASGALT